MAAEDRLLLAFLVVLAAAVATIAVMGLVDWAAEHRRRGDCPECEEHPR